MPPFVGVAVNVTIVPATIFVSGLQVIFTLTGMLGETLIVIVFDVTGFAARHPPRLEVTSQLM